MHVSQLTSWVTPSTPPSQSGTWVCGLTQIFPSSKHVQNVCKGCFIQLTDFRNIRQFLTHDASVSVANAFVSSRLYYCNSLFRGPNPIFIDYSQDKTVQLELLQIRVNILKLLRYSGNSTGFLYSFAGSSNWLPWCISLFILVFLNILLHTYPHTALLTAILDIVGVLPISSM